GVRPLTFSQNNFRCGKTSPVFESTRLCPKVSFLSHSRAKCPSSETTLKLTMANTGWFGVVWGWSAMLKFTVVAGTIGGFLQSSICCPYPPEKPDNHIPMTTG